MAGKKYLFVCNLPDNRDLTDKVVNAFRRKAFLTEDILFFVAYENEETHNYLGLFPCIVPGRSCNIQVLLKNFVSVEEIIKQVDYYIVGNVPNELSYINCAIRNNVEIIGTIEDEEEMFSNIVVSQEATKWKKEIHFSLVNQVFKRFPQDEWEYFLFHNGLGESMSFFFWLKEYRKRHHKKIFLFCVHKSHVDFMQLSPYVDFVAQINWQVFDYISVYLSEEYRIRNFYTFHLAPEVVKAGKSLSPRERVGFVWKARAFLGINPDVPFEKYPVEIPAESVANARRVFQELGGVERKSVFFVAKGYSNDMPGHDDFWLKLAESLKSKGFEVFTNGTEETIPGCKNIFLSLPETVEFVRLCGNVVGIRTGFCELTCVLNFKDPIKLFSITHNKNDDFFKQEVWMYGSLEIVRVNGRRRAEGLKADYLKFLSPYLGKNIDFSCHILGNNPEEDDILIEELTKKITEEN